MRLLFRCSLAGVILSCLFSLLSPSLVSYAVAPNPVASYILDVTLDVGTKRLRGHEVIHYVNRTSEAISELVFHLYLNAFRSAETIFLRESGGVHRGNRWDPQHPGWIRVNNIGLDDGTPLTLEEVADGTLAHAVLPTPLQAGETFTVELDFEAQLPRVFARTGFVNDFFMVGQWFPKLGVWEKGVWNAYPFHANSEFYADFGHYDVTITLPQGYVTGATGAQVAASTQPNGNQTVRYYAANVIDFAWVACPRFREAERRVGDIQVLFLYLPEHRWMVRRVLNTAEAALTRCGRWYGPYPYGRLTIVDVPDDALGAGGMEYPMLVTAGPLSVLGLSRGAIRSGVDRSLELVVAHEIGHQWWQSVVATNEAEEPWLDEGFTDYSTLRLAGEMDGPGGPVLNVGGQVLSYLDMHRLVYATAPHLPMAGRAWEFSAAEYSVVAYTKPVLALLTLERMLGEETMLRIMRAYFARYRFAHPSTEDFRQVVEEVAGQDVAWFFDGLVYGSGVINYAVTSMEGHEVLVSRQGELSIPTEIRITFADGSTVFEQWNGEETVHRFAYPDRPRIVHAAVDPDHKIAVDLCWADNLLTSHVQLATVVALAAQWIYRFQDVLLALGGLW